MATLTIRNLDDRVKQALRERAARNGVSMEEEARRVLRTGLSTVKTGEEASKQSLWDRVSILRDTYGTAELESPERTGLAGERKMFDDWQDHS